MNIILSPHFDDAVLSLGGLLAREGRDSVVATFFTKIPGTPLVTKWDTKCGFKDSTEAVTARTEEDRASLTFLGVHPNRIHTYAHLESQYRTTLTKYDQPIEEPALEALLVEDIKSLIQEYREETLNIFVPGFEVHFDHRILKHAAFAAFEQLPREKKHNLFLYQDLPYAISLLKKAQPRNLWSRLLHRFSFDPALLERAIFPQDSSAFSLYSIQLSKKEMDSKLSGIRLYTSQVDHLEPPYLCWKIKHFAAIQAKHLILPSPYCEVAYRLF